MKPPHPQQSVPASITDVASPSKWNDATIDSTPPRSTSCFASVFRTPVQAGASRTPSVGPRSQAASSAAEDAPASAPGPVVPDAGLPGDFFRCGPTAGAPARRECPVPPPLAAMRAAVANSAGATDAEGMLVAAQALRAEAEAVARKREGAIAFMHQELEETRRAAQQREAQAGKRYSVIKAELVEVKAQLAARSQAVRDEAAVARRWEAAWAQEEAAARALAAERDAARAAQAEAEAARDAEHAEAERYAEAARAVSPLKEKLAAAVAAHAAALVRAAAAVAEAAELRETLPGAQASLAAAEAATVRAERAEAAQRVAEEALGALRGHAERDRAAHDKEMRELRRALAEARELSAQLCGQRNAKQKIQHVLQVKAERDALQRENARLAAQLRAAGAPPAAAKVPPSAAAERPAAPPAAVGAGAVDAAVRAVVEGLVSRVAAAQCCAAAAGAPGPRRPAAASPARAPPPRAGAAASPGLTEPRSPCLATSRRRVPAAAPRRTPPAPAAPRCAAGRAVAQAATAAAPAAPSTPSPTKAAAAPVTPVTVQRPSAGAPGSKRVAGRLGPAQRVVSKRETSKGAGSAGSTAVRGDLAAAFGELKAGSVVEV
jgi:hypothetical protein